MKRYAPGAGWSWINAGGCIHHAGGGFHHAGAGLHHAGAGLHHAGGRFHHTGGGFHLAGGIPVAEQLANAIANFLQLLPPGLQRLPLSASLEAPKFLRQMTVYLLVNS